MKHFDILKWWKSYESTFPVLFKMTRDLLTPQVSTVASESTFSIAANILGEKRTRLSDEMLESLTCLKDWEDARFRLQEVEKVDLSFFQASRLKVLSFFLQVYFLQ